MPVGTDIARLNTVIDELETGIAADLETAQATEEELRFLRAEIDAGITRLSELRLRLDTTRGG